MTTKKNNLPIRKKQKTEWDQDSVNQFRRDYPARTDDELCQMYNTNLHKVQQLAMQYRLGKDKRVLLGVVKMPRWTKEQIEILKKLYKDNDNITVAKAVGKSVKAVVSKAFFLGLKKTKDQLTKTAKKNVSYRSAHQKVAKMNKRKKQTAEKKKNVATKKKTTGTKKKK
jgi:glucan-binding YG repeat protein